jgi:hypothetical protein
VRRGIHIWAPLQFEHVSIWLWTHDDADGAAVGRSGLIRPVGVDPGPSISLADFRHSLELEQAGDQRVLRAGRFELELTDGRTESIEVERDGPVLALVGGGYGGPDAMGRPKGPRFVRHDKYRTDRKSLGELPHTILEHCCIARWGNRVGRGDVEVSAGEYAPLGFGPVG